MIIVGCLTLGVLLLTQPGFFTSATPSHASLPPTFTFDPVLGLPISVLGLRENLHSQCLAQFEALGGQNSCPADITSFVCVALNPVLASYVLILACICHRVHVGVVALWMGLGTLAATFYGEFKGSFLSVGVIRRTFPLRACMRAPIFCDDFPFLSTVATQCAGNLHASAYIAGKERA